MGYIFHFYSFRQTCMRNVMNYATLLAEMFLGGGGGVGIYAFKFVSHIHNCYQTDQYKMRIPKK